MIYSTTNILKTHKEVSGYRSTPFLIPQKLQSQSFMFRPHKSGAATYLINSAPVSTSHISLMICGTEGGFANEMWDETSLLRRTAYRPTIIAIVTKHAFEASNWCLKYDMRHRGRLQERAMGLKFDPRDGFGFQCRISTK